MRLLKICQEIAGAMEYLSKKGFIHRDLAARNILLDCNCRCKVGNISDVCGESVHTLVCIYDIVCI